MYGCCIRERRLYICGLAVDKEYAWKMRRIRKMECGRGGLPSFVCEGFSCVLCSAMSGG